MQKFREIAVVIALFSFIWLGAYFLYSGFFGADETGYALFSRNIPAGIKECFQGHRMLHLVTLSLFSWNLPLTKFYGYVFSVILILGYYLIVKRIIARNDSETAFLSLLMLITSPIFIALAPTAYTEIPALSLALLSLFCYLKRKFSFSGAFAALSVFFKEIGLFAEGAIVMDILLFQRKKEHLKQIMWFTIFFFPLFLAYFFLTGKIWFLDFFLRSAQTYAHRFSLVYDFVIRRIAFLSLLGAGALPLFNVKKLKETLTSLPDVFKFYLLISLLAYFLFHAVSPRFSIFFLPVFFFSALCANKKRTKLFIFLFILQSALTLYAIHVFVQPFRMEKEVANFVEKNFSPNEFPKVYGFSFPVSEKLKEKGFEIAKNKSAADIIFADSKNFDEEKFRIIKTVKIPCTMKFFRMLKCEDKEYVIAVRKS